jgi:hypothetical protein
MPLTGVPNHAELQSQRAGPSGARQRRPDGPVESGWRIRLCVPSPRRTSRQILPLTSPCLAAQYLCSGRLRWLEVLLGAALLLSGAEPAIDDGLAEAGIDFGSDLLTVTHVLLVYPIALFRYRARGCPSRCAGPRSAGCRAHPGRPHAVARSPRRRPCHRRGATTPRCPPAAPFLAVDPVPEVGQPPSARGTHVRTASCAPQNPAGPCGANGAVIAPSNRSSSPGTRASTRDRAYSTRSRLRNDVPDRELGRRPRLTDLAEDAPVADQLPVVTPHFRPPGARRLGGLKGTVSPTSGALHENAGRPSERPHGCNEGEQRQVGPTPTPCSSSARDHDRRDRPRECRQARNVRVGATKNDMTLSTTAVTRLQGVGATAHRTADDSALRHVRLVAPLSHASGTFDPRCWLSRAGRR